MGPSPRPVTPELFAVGVVIVAVPLTSVHNPVPSTGTFPLSVAVLPQTFADTPAFDAVGEATLVMVTCAELAVHGAFEIVH